MWFYVFLLGRWRLADSEGRAKPLDVRWEKRTDLCSNYHRSELEIVSCTNFWSNHHSRCRVPMTISKTIRLGTFCLEPPSWYTVIRVLSAELEIAWKDDSVHICIQLCHSGHQNRCLSLCCIVNGSHCVVRCAVSPRCCKRFSPYEQETVLL